MDWQKLLSSLLPVLGEAGIDAAAEALDKLAAETTEPWKRTLLELLAEGVSIHGLLGLQLAIDTVEAIADGQPIQWEDMDLTLHSELLASLQAAEADRKSQAMDFLAHASEALGGVLAGLLRGVVSAR